MADQEGKGNTTGHFGMFLLSGPLFVFERSSAISAERSSQSAPG